MIIPCMNSTSARERGGSVPFVDGGNVLVGSPGAPGCTTTGFAAPLCCAHASAQPNKTSAPNATEAPQRPPQPFLPKNLITIRPISPRGYYHFLAQLRVA